MAPSSPFSLDHLPPSEQLCYVHCNFCDTVLAVRVPCSCLSTTVAVRCGHCTGLLSVNMRGLPLPAANQLSFNHSLLSASHNLLEETPTLPQSSLINQSNPIETLMSTLRVDESPKAPPVNRRIVGIDKKRYYKKIPFLASLQVTNATNVCLFHGAFVGST